MSKQHPSTGYSIPTFKILPWVPTWTSFNGGQWYYEQNKPLPSHVAYGHTVLSQQLKHWLRQWHLIFLSMIFVSCPPSFWDTVLVKYRLCISCWSWTHYDPSASGASVLKWQACIHTCPLPFVALCMLGKWVWAFLFYVLVWCSFGGNQYKISMKRAVHSNC